MRAILFATFLMIGVPAMAGETVIYNDGDVTLEGYVAKTDKPNAPVVLVVHQWRGLSAHEKEHADMLAKEGYNAFAIDMYGQGIRPQDPKDAGAEATKYKTNAPLARQRLKAAIDYAKTIQGVDASRMAIMGYCFGGTMALEAARMGADLKAAVSFHGGLGTPAPAKAGDIKASIAVHHGADDPLVPPAEVEGFIKEMKESKADWVFTEYAGAVHAFTHKDAGNDPSTGLAYNEKADKRSWSALLSFLKETL
ncbi:MAG: dienelactone hydrolase family protein [Alphaproteobacteria bacterium]|nr:dienelactone hydrolase family protein [Alphaproteobacteria bacterium]